jgi:Tat protein translocase TatB subunit
MFNVGGPEIVVVLLVALVVLGPDQLPKAMRTFGNVMAQIRKVSNGFQDEMRNAMNSIEASTSMPTGTDSTSSSSGPAATEVVARNDAPPSGAEQASAPVAPAVDPVSNRPGISAADRAAG